MAKTLIGVVSNNGKTTATYRYTIAGATKQDSREIILDDAAMYAACDAVLAEPGFGPCKGFQLYTEITDREFGGAIVDIFYGADSRMVRIGDDEVVPPSLASARDAFKTAVQAAL